MFVTLAKAKLCDKKKIWCDICSHYSFVLKLIKLMCLLPLQYKTHTKQKQHVMFCWIYNKRNIEMRWIIYLINLKNEYRHLKHRYHRIINIPFKMLSNYYVVKLNFFDIKLENLNYSTCIFLSAEPSHISVNTNRTIWRRILFSHIS